MKLDLRDMGEGMDLIHVAQDRISCGFLRVSNETSGSLKCKDFFLTC
jgi:hypothetical protein